MYNWSHDEHICAAAGSQIEEGISVHEILCKVHELLFSGPEKDLDQLSATGVQNRIMS